MRPLKFWPRLALSTCLSLVGCFSLVERICAQNLSGVRIGDDFSSAAKQIGFPPASSERSGPYIAAKWVLGDGNTLSATGTAIDGKIVYVESDWGGQLRFWSARLSMRRRAPTAAV
jgi:hypothetical protein